MLDLKTEAERRIIEAGSNLPGDSTFVLWDVDVFPDGDSTLAVVISDRSRAPNLAAIRELAVGVANRGDVPAEAGEVWLDDVRLDQAPDDGGLAGRAGLRVDLADVLSLQGDFSAQNPYYRQLGGKPSFRSNWDLRTRATLEFGRFLPAAWGLSAPIDFQHDESSDDPFFLPQTDVRAGGVKDLRTGAASMTRWSAGLSKRTQSGSAILRSTIDGMRFTYSHRSNSSTATQTESSGSGWNASLSWARSVVDKSFPVVPGFLQDAIDLLPDFISESVLLRNFKDLRFRWTPRQMSLGASLAKSANERRRFETSVRSSTDADVEPTIDRQNLLQPTAGIELQPFASLVYGVTFRSARDLVGPRFRVQGEAARRLLRGESTTLLGLSVGWETSRAVQTRFSWQPELASWFDTRFTVTTNYNSLRNASYVKSVEGDTILVRDLSMNRDMSLSVDVRPVDFLTAFGVPEKTEARGFLGGLREVWDRLRPLRVDWGRTVNATFDREDLRPGFGEYLVASGFDGLRILGADTAAAAGDNRRLSIRGGYRLPFGLQADLDYNRRETSAFTVLSERGSLSTEWPAIRLNWRNAPLPGSFRRGIRMLTLSAGWRERERLTRTQTGQDRGSDETVRSVGMLMVFANGFNLSYQYDNTLMERTDATGFSESSRGSHSVRATGTVRPPGFLSFLKRPLRLSADYSRNGNFDCRELGGAGFSGDPLGLGEDCVAHIDQTTQNAAFTLDTDFTGYSVGVQFSWTRRGSAVGRQQTSNQYNLNVFGRFFFRSDEGRPD